MQNHLTYEELMGYSVQKTLRACATDMGSINTASWYIADPLFYAKFSIWVGRFSKFYPNLLKFEKIWK